MYSGYFAIGGVEVGNSERARGLQETSDCPINWIVDDERCDTLAEALGDSEYTAANITEAPWYDPDDPDLSSRIMGLYVMSMTGLQDSTREAKIKQKVTSGAQIGRTRYAGKAVRVRVMLTAQGQDALDAGVTWLNSALNADSCGFHSEGPGCGLTDFQYFTTCPPPRDDSVSYSPWVVARRNLFPNPRGTSVGPAFWRPLSGTLALRTDMPGDIPTAVRWTRTTPGVASLGMVVGDDMPTAGTVHVMMRIRVAAPMTVDIVARPDVTVPTGQVSVMSSLNLPIGVTEVNTTFPAFTTAAGADSGLAIVIPSNVNGTTLDVTSVLIETGTGDYFDGSGANGTLLRHSWVGWGGYGMGPYGEGHYGGDGGVNWSQSVEETRVITDSPDTAEEYSPIVDRYRRYLHSVKCVSGPYVQEEFMSNDGRYVALVMEFLIASEVSHVFTKTREILVPPTIPSPVQDIPFNKASYPSAEIDDGADVIVAVNHSTNPSLETDATGWSPLAPGGGPVTPLIAAGDSPVPYFTSGRVTGELAASGTASYRARILGNGSTTAGGIAELQTSNAVSLAGLPSGTRPSLGLWVALVNVGGSHASYQDFYSLYVRAIWYSGSTIVLNEVIGSTTTDFSGRAYSLKSRPIPAGADTVKLFAIATVGWSSSATPANNSDMRMYVDAAAVTVP